MGTVPEIRAQPHHSCRARLQKASLAPCQANCWGHSQKMAAELQLAPSRLVRRLPLLEPPAQLPRHFLQQIIFPVVAAHHQRLLLTVLAAVEPRVRPPRLKLPPRRWQARDSPGLADAPVATAACLNLPLALKHPARQQQQQLLLQQQHQRRLTVASEHQGRELRPARPFPSGDAAGDVVVVAPPPTTPAVAAVVAPAPAAAAGPRGRASGGGGLDTPTAAGAAAGAASSSSVANVAAFGTSIRGGAGGPRRPGAATGGAAAPALTPAAGLGGGGRDNNPAGAEAAALAALPASTDGAAAAGAAAARAPGRPRAGGGGGRDDTTPAPGSCALGGGGRPRGSDIAEGSREIHLDTCLGSVMSPRTFLEGYFLYLETLVLAGCGVFAVAQPAVFAGHFVSVFEHATRTTGHPAVRRSCHQVFCCVARYLSRRCV